MKPEEVLKKVQASLDSHKIKAIAKLGGSYAKNTYLDDFDCDIFVIFDISYKNKNLSDLTEKVIKQFKPTRVHGSRDYFQFKRKIEYEIIPVLDVKDPKNIVNVTDMSPFHVDWVNNNIKKFANEIRNAKLFCKANDLYGAESHINGFSGYVLEILVIYYKGFENLLKAASKWEVKQIIDINKKHSNAIESLNSSKTFGPLITIDPVQDDRNASAALSLEQFSKFILLSKLYLESPDDSFFQKSKFNKKDLIKETKDGFNLTIIQVKPLTGKNDIIGSKIIKFINSIGNQIELNDFKIFDSGFNWDDEVIIWFMTWPNILPKYKKQLGPKIYANNEDFFKFIDKHKEISLDKDNIYAKVKRKFIAIDKLIVNLLKEKHIKNKIKKITKLEFH